MTRRLVLAMTIVAGLVAVALAIPLAVNAANDVRDDFIAGLEIRALSAASLLSSQDRQDWQGTVVDAARESGARVVVVDAMRTLVADSEQSAVERAFDRPEIDQALAGRLDSDVRASATLGTDLRFVAAPIVQGRSVVGAVRFSLPESLVTEQVRSTVLWLLVFIVAVMVAAGLVAWLLARSIAGPLRRLSQVATDLPEDLTLRAEERDGPIEVRSVAVALNGTADRLIGLLRRQERVAADASHHLRTPLTGVRLRLEAIEDTSDQESVRLQAIAATTEVDRLTRRIDQVLELARADAGAGRAERIDASDLVGDRLAAAGVVAQERGLVLESRVTPGIVVSCAVGTVARVIDELVGNAFSYARGCVLVTLVRTPDEAVLTVEDDGSGLPETELETIFERFRRGSGSIDGGSGLGLALVRESARASGGDASARRSAMGGLAVTVGWPITN